VNEIAVTIIPIFVVICIGWAARKRGYAPPEFLAPANSLVYHIAIPAMIFRSVSRADFASRFDPTVLMVTMASMVVVYGLSWWCAGRLKLKPGPAGTFMQSAFHCNMGYIGLAVSYYYLGDDGLARAGILAGFLMILQNFLAVTALQTKASGGGGRPLPVRQTFLKIAGNPVILSALAGIIVSTTDTALPTIVNRCLAIVSGMALPMALLIIGASLTFHSMRPHLGTVFLASIMKLLVMPALAFAGFLVAGTAPDLYLPGLILLASPTATLTYILAREIGGDEQMAVAAISISTLLSAGTFFFWLQVAG
jgi:predicted permease